jgi:hypothetical protein
MMGRPYAQDAEGPRDATPYEFFPRTELRRFDRLFKMRMLAAIKLGLEAPPALGVFRSSGAKVRRE